MRTCKYASIGGKMKVLHSSSGGDYNKLGMVKKKKRKIVDMSTYIIKSAHFLSKLHLPIKSALLKHTCYKEV